MSAWSRRPCRSHDVPFSYEYRALQQCLQPRPWWPGGFFVPRAVRVPLGCCWHAGRPSRRRQPLQHRGLGECACGAVVTSLRFFFSMSCRWRFGHVFYKSFALLQFSVFSRQEECIVEQHSRHSRWPMRVGIHWPTQIGRQPPSFADRSPSDRHFALTVGVVY